MQTKLKSYTIIEVLFAMLITSIVVVMVYLFIDTVYQRYKMYSELTEELSDLSSFKNTFKKDFFYAEKVIQKNESVIFFTNEEEVSYSFSEKVTRTANNNKDLFDVKIEGILIKAKDSIEKKLVNTIVLKTQKGSDIISFTFFKKKGVANAINDFFYNENNSEKSF